MNTSCNECGAALSVPSAAIAGEIVSCKDCSTEYEVADISNGSVLLKPAELVGEVWGE